MKKIEDVSDLNNKKVLLRLDLNVPLKNGNIIDTTRIDKILPTIYFLIQKKSKIIIISHIGRPQGKVDKNLSMLPVCNYLSKKINLNVELINEKIFNIDPNLLFKDDDNKIIFLENIRFYEEEEKNSDEFAKILSNFGEIYINDAFSCSHRAHTSVDKITKFLPSYCGIQMNSEVTALKKVTSNIERPITCIIGGSKISTKIKVIRNLISKFENIVIVGGMANSVLKQKGINIGNSYIESNSNPIIEEIFSLAKKIIVKLLFPWMLLSEKNLRIKLKLKIYLKYKMTI